jgi:hypothetical protein
VNGRRYVAISQLKPVISADGPGLVRKACPVKRAIEPVAATVSSEDTTGSVTTVSRGRQPDDKKASSRIAEAGNGSAPVLLIFKPAHSLSSNCRPPFDQARTLIAVNDLALENDQLPMVWIHNGTYLKPPGRANCCHSRSVARA